MKREWPRQQSLSDLAAVVRATRGATSRVAEGEHAERLAALPDQQSHPMAVDDDYLTLLEKLDTASQGADTEAAVFAMAVLLADGLQDQVGPSQPMAQTLHRLSGAPQPQIAALWRAAYILSLMRHETPDMPDGPQYLSETRDAVIPPLVHLARGLDAAAIESIAQADHGMDADKHAAGLRATLASDTGRVPQQDPWYPREVLSLTTHCLDTQTHWRCLALVILDDIHDRSALDHMTFRWMSNAPAILDMPPHFRVPILRGIRHVMEQLEPGDWNPYFDSYRPEKRENWHVLPWYDDLVPA